MDAINRCFDKSSVEDILVALEKEDSDWAKKQLEARIICLPNQQSFNCIFFSLADSCKNGKVENKEIPNFELQ